MNNVSLIGRLVQDPELKQTSKGANYCRFTIAVKRQVKKSEGVQDTDFIECIAWRKTADLLYQYFFKGSLLGLYGKVITSEYEKDGQKHKRQEILANEIYILDKKDKKPEQRVESPSAPGQVSIDEGGEFEQLPFEIT